MQEYNDTEWRTQVYALLANLLARAPEQDLLNNIAALELDEPDSPLSAGWQALIAAADEVTAEQVFDEYQLLFIGITQGEVVPYGSFYQTGFLNEKPLAELRADLSRLGLARTEEAAEPEDHAAGVCDVMRLILSAEGTPIVDASTFFNRHLAPWMRDFFSDLQRADSAQFYSAVGLLGDAFIELETRRLAADEN